MEYIVDDGEQLNLIERWQRHKDQAARTKLLESFQPQIIAAAKKHPAATPSCLDDLISAASIGFLIALDRFDASKGCKLQTYARHWIRAELNRAAEDLNPSYKLRRWLKRRDNETEAEYKDRTGLVQAALNPGDIDAPLYKDNPDSESVGSIVPDDDADDTYPLGYTPELIATALSQLASRDRRILEARHLNDTPVTLDRLGAELGISSERVRQLESHAIEEFSASIRQATLSRNDRARAITAAAFQNKGATKAELINLNAGCWRGGNYATISAFRERHKYFAQAERSNDYGAIRARRLGREALIGVQKQCQEYRDRAGLSRQAIVAKYQKDLISRGYSPELVADLMVGVQRALGPAKLKRRSRKLRPKTKFRSWRAEEHLGWGAAA